MHSRSVDLGERKGDSKLGVPRTRLDVDLGVVVAQQAPDDIEEVAKRLARTVSGASGMRNAARAAAEPYGLAAMAETLIRLYESLLAEGERSTRTHRTEAGRAL